MDAIHVGTYVLELVHSVTLKVQISEHVMHTCHACVTMPIMLSCFHAFAYCYCLHYQWLFT